ncbi:uncharacterized protein YraI [Deinobacterium chartae]|uniref:Uncharacterized protein YraI n=1 Tax=Deinobacterium chartae TaxID=521158 RepID=A0A841HZJ8_9DEIO|nr:hypothetical protein [Deinobacterium chartae]MBB6097630.1 uncharacterized protein YraI [Deinobacterium chartae]
MRKILSALLLGLTLAPAALALGATTHTNVNLRQALTAQATKLKVLPTHTSLEVAWCSNNWCAVSVRTNTGVLSG